MSDKDSGNDKLPKADITRRTIFTLATAVATFGVAMGMRATSARAESGLFLKGTSSKTKNEGSTHLKSTSNTKSKGEGNQTIKLKKNGEK